MKRCRIIPTFSMQNLSFFAVWIGSKGSSVSHLGRKLDKHKTASFIATASTYQSRTYVTPYCPLSGLCGLLEKWMIQTISTNRYWLLSLLSTFLYFCRFILMYSKIKINIEYIWKNCSSFGREKGKEDSIFEITPNLFYFYGIYVKSMTWKMRKLTFFFALSLSQKLKKHIIYRS